MKGALVFEVKKKLQYRSAYARSSVESRGLDEE
jgi:hypothetical protein